MSSSQFYPNSNPGTPQPIQKSRTFPQGFSYLAPQPPPVPPKPRINYPGSPQQQRRSFQNPQQTFPSPKLPPKLTQQFPGSPQQQRRSFQNSQQTFPSPKLSPKLTQQFPGSPRQQRRSFQNSQQTFPSPKLQWSPKSPKCPNYASPTFTSPEPPILPSASTTMSDPYHFEEFRPVRIIGVANQPTFDPANRQKFAFLDSTSSMSTPRRRDRVAVGENISIKISKTHYNKFLKFYSNIIFNYPIMVMITTLMLSMALPMCLLHLFPLKLNENPEKGFDTRGTQYSGHRLTWSKLQPYLFQSSRVIVKQPPPPLEEIKVVDAASIIESRKNISESSEVTGRPRRALDDLFEGLTTVSCYEIGLLQMDYMAQFIIELDSYDKLYDLKFHQELCSFQEKLQSTFVPFFSVSPYRSIFHISNFAGCLAPNQHDNCTSLTYSDLKGFRILVEFCTKSKKFIIECGRDCIGSVENIFNERKNCQSCEKIPSNCTNQMWFDLFYRILPMDLMTRKSSKEKIYINNFLPFYTFSSYSFQGFDVPLRNFINFEKKFKMIGENLKNLKIKGYLLDIKRNVLFDSAVEDSQLAMFAGISIFILVLVYSCSIGYTIAVSIELAASVLISAAIYRYFSPEFPLLNLVAFVLLLSIGTDGAFLLFNMFPEQHKLLEEDNFYKCLEHTITTMFLAQFSTVVPFVLNLVSNVIAFRSFGLFASLMLIFNYFLLISFLPAYLIFHRRYINAFIDNKLSSYQNLINSTCSPIQRIRRTIKKLATESLPGILIEGRYVWLLSLSILIIAGGWITITQLRLPQYNPLQLFVSGNPHEWYDNHAEQLFEFVSKKIALPLTVRLLFGFKGVDETAHFDPNALENVTQDRGFDLKSKEDIRRLADDMQRFRMMDFIGSTKKFWPERFIDWSTHTTCSADIAVCCNIDSKFYQDDFLDYCMRVSTSQIPTGYNDTPIYHNISFDLVGYTALLPTKLKYSHKFQNLSKSFELFDRNFISSFTHAFFYTTEWTLMSTWYDLQRSIINDCKQSVIVSFIVVFIFAAIVLKWKSLVTMISMMSIVICTVGTVVALGWEIGVLEAVILVLVVSLSFDYTLHYGAAVPSNGCAVHRITSATRKAIIPVTMAAASSTLAGSIILLSQTHAFFQVATFLVISALISHLFATFFFLPLLYVFLPGISKTCDECDQIEDEIRKRRNIPMQMMRNGEF